MRIASFKVENYKSFSATQDISFGPGFNVIVGRNDVGKTAFVEALSFFPKGHKYHRSAQTVPVEGAIIRDPASRNEVAFEFEEGELFDFFKHFLPEFDVMIPGEDEIDVHRDRILAEFP